MIKLIKMPEYPESDQNINEIISNWYMTMCECVASINEVIIEINAKEIENDG